MIVRIRPEESMECFPKRVGIKTRDDLFEDAPQALPTVKRLSNHHPPERDVESPNFRQPTGFENARRQSDTLQTIGKSPLDDMTDVKPGIMEMIQEERRVSKIRNPFL